jgi:hypothetical protein
MSQRGLTCAGDAAPVEELGGEEGASAINPGRFREVPVEVVDERGDFGEIVSIPVHQELHELISENRVASASDPSWSTDPACSEAPVSRSIRALIIQAAGSSGNLFEYRCAISIPRFGSFSIEWAR